MYKRKVTKIEDEKSSKKQKNELEDIDMIDIEDDIEEDSEEDSDIVDIEKDTKINLSEKIDNFIDGYPFSVITDSPIIGNNLNFYTQFANFDNNKSFFNTMLELEKYYYIMNKKNNEKYTLDKNELLKIYMNMLFKIDTIHDFTDNRSVINNIRTFDKQYIKSLLNWDNDSIKKFIKKMKEKKEKISKDLTDVNENIQETNVSEEDIIHNIDNMSQDVDNLYEENGEPIERDGDEQDIDSDIIEVEEGEKNIIKGNNSTGMENALLYWLIKNFKYDDNVIYASSSIENFSSDLSEQNIKLNIVVDAGEKRITNFKDILLFQKYINVKKKEAKNNNFYDKNDIVEKINKFDNLNCTIIFPQLFDANTTTGNSIKWRNVELISMSLDVKKSYFIEFDIIDDKCKMIYNNDKSFDFFINNDNYLLNKIKMVKTDEKFADNGILIDNVYMYNKQLELKLEELNELIKSNNKNIDTNIKKYYKKKEKIKLYKQNLDIFIKKNNNIDYIICLNSGPGVSLLSEYYQNKTNNLSNNIKNIINVYENIINTSTDEDYEKLLNAVNIIQQGKNKKKILIIDDNIKNKISEKYGFDNKFINDNISNFENIVINSTKNDYYDFINNIIINNIKENLVKEIKIINDNISDFQDYNIYNKRELYYILKLLFKNIRRTLTNNTTINATLSDYNDNLAHNVFTIKRAGDYSQIYYCKYYSEEKSDYIYCSNDRMSASFCYLNKVNFIGPFSDTGIFIKFNNNIKIKSPVTSFNIDNTNYYPYMSITEAPNISKYIKYIQLNEISMSNNKIFNNLDKLLDLEIKKNKNANIVKSYKDLSFKMDTVHDFEGSRVKSKINNILDILWDDIIDFNTSKESIKQLILEVIKNDNFEKIYFYWLLKRQSNTNISKKNKLLYNPVITFTSSIENFANCIILNENKKVFFNIDASNESIKNFKNIVISNLINIDKLKEYTLHFKEDNKTLKKIYNQYNKTYNEIFIDKLLYNDNTKDIEKSNRNYIIKCIYNIIMNHYEEPNLNQTKQNKNTEYYFDNFLNIFTINNNDSSRSIDENSNIYINRLMNDYINKYNLKEKGIDDILTREKNIELKKKKKNYETEQDIKLNIKSIDDIFNKFLELPVYSNFIMNVTSLIKLINNDINFNIYDVENITKLIEPLRNIIIDIINKPVSKKSKNIQIIISNDIYKYIENEFNSYYNELVSVDFIKLSYNNLYNKLFLQYIYNTLSSENNNIQFKITPPQLIDANATTGISIKLKNVNIISKTDTDSKPCNYLLYNFLKFIKTNEIKYNQTSLINEMIRTFNIYYKSFNKIYNDMNTSLNENINKILNNYKNNIISKLSIDEINEILNEINKLKNIITDNINDSKTIFYNTDEMKIKEKMRQKKKEEKKEKRNINNITDVFYETVNVLNDFILIYKEYIYEIIYYIKNNYNIKIDINHIKNKLIADCKLYSSNEKIYTVNQLSELYKKLLYIIKYDVEFMNNLLSIIIYHNRNKCFEDINILSDNINTLYNIEKYFMYHIIDNKVQTEQIDIEIMNLSFDNKNYLIKNIKVLKIDNNETDDIEYINKNLNVILRKNNMLNIMASLILKDLQSLINISNKNILKVYDENNIDNIINMINKEDNNIINLMNIYENNKNILIKPIDDKEFYYSTLNYTLYSLENGSPGVKDLLTIHESIVKFYDNESLIFLNNLYKNIFAIKRSGDYLQIDYCKKNNYIFISTDAMSASFCFIENCEFIGPFGPYGLFIKKKINDKQYCYRNEYDRMLYNP